MDYRDYEKILHFGFAHDATGALAGCMMFVLLPMPVIFFVISIILRIYIMTVIVGVLLLLIGGVLLTMKLKSEPFAPMVITDKRLLSIVGGDYQSRVDNPYSRRAAEQFDNFFIQGVADPDEVYRKLSEAIDLARKTNAR